MQRFAKILVGVDLASEAHLVSSDGVRRRCSDALAKASWLATQSGAALRIVHALPLDARAHDLVLRHGGQGSVSPIEAAEERVRELASGAAEFGIEASSSVVVGPPAQTLLAEASSWGADLLVVAGRDRGNPLGLLGSTAGHLFRFADLPVWVARRGTRHALREVLAAVALDEHSHGVLRLAADTARRMGARLHVLHVTRDDDPDQIASSLDALRGWTHVHAADVAIGGVDVLRGAIGERILEAAASIPADAVFIGPSKRSVLLRRLRGETAKPLLARLGCSLICARGVPGSPHWPRVHAGQESVGSV